MKKEICLKPYIFGFWKYFIIVIWKGRTNVIHRQKHDGQL